MLLSPQIFQEHLGGRAKEGANSTGLIPASLFSPLNRIKSSGQAVEYMPRRVDGESPKIGQAASRACTHAHRAEVQRPTMALATRWADAMVVVVVEGAGAGVAVFKYLV